MNAASPLDDLRSKCAREWPHLTTAAERTEALLSDLKGLQNLRADNTSIVVFGSLERRELTEGSDVDWSLIIDGPSDPEHLKLAYQIGQRLGVLGLAAPGKTGTFGAMVSSHELIHNIGGIQDTNQNLTRCLLLLLESLAIGDNLTHRRVLKGVLLRYLVHDQSVSLGAREAPEAVVPRFLLNDVVRFWRTMAVDYAAKRWEQRDQKWAIRNAKLRMSRKLLFVSGLFMCFGLALLPPEESSPDLDENARELWLVDYFARLAESPPIEILSRVLVSHGSKEAALAIFDAYDEFLGILDDRNSRNRLENLEFADATEDPLFQRIRGINHGFQAGLNRLFFEDSDRLRELVHKYGIF